MYNIHCWIVCIAVVLGLGSAPTWALEKSNQFERFKTVPKKKSMFGEDLDVGVTAKLNSQNQNIAIDAKWALDPRQLVKGAVFFTARESGDSYGCSVFYEYRVWETMAVHMQLDYRQYTDRSRVVAAVGARLWTDGPSPHSSITLDYQFAVYGSEGDRLLVRFRNKF